MDEKTSTWTEYYAVDCMPSFQPIIVDGYTLLFNRTMGGFLQTEFLCISV